MRAKLPVVWILLTLLACVHAFGQGVTLSITPAPGVGQAGGKVIFNATVTNTGSAAVNLNQLSVTVQNTDLISVDPTAFYTNFAVVLAPGAQIANLPIFEADIDPTTPSGTYTGTAAILGGADSNATNNLAQQDFQVTVSGADRNPPATFIIGGPDEGGGVCGTAVMFSFTGIDDVTPVALLTYRYQLDGGAWQGPTGDTSVTLTGLTDGPHVFEVEAIDQAGNVDPNPPARGFFVETAPPTIFGVHTGHLKPSTVDIQWVTDHPADSQVDYGPTSAYGSSTPLNSNLVTVHTVTLTGLVPGQTVHYRVKSNDPCGGQSVSADQSFDFPHLNSLIATPDQIPLTIKPGQTITTHLTLTSLSAAGITGINVSVQDAAANINVQAVPPNTLKPMDSQQFNVTVTALDASVLQNAPTLNFVDDQGDQAQATLNVTVTPPQPQLVVTPAALNASMTRGQQAFTECQITNTGGVTATSVQVTLPGAAWMSLATPDQIGDIAPGQTAKITVALQPAASLTLGPYTGNLAVNATNASASIPYTFNCVSNAKGDLKVVAQDEYSFFAADQPNVVGANVVVTDPQSGAVVAQGVTDTTGSFVQQGLPEGHYNLEVMANQHGAARLTTAVIAGQQSETDAFLPLQLVTYTWTVEPVNTPDQYIVDLQATFQTHVPAPVLTLDPELLDLRTVSFDSHGKAVVYYTITNHGLIASNNVHIAFDQDPSYQFQPLASSLGTLGALSTVVVPVTITNTVGPHIASGCGVNCYVDGYHVCSGKVDDRASGFAITRTCSTYKYPQSFDPGGNPSGNPPGDIMTVNNPPIFEQDQCCLTDCAVNIMATGFDATHSAYIEHDSNGTPSMPNITFEANLPSSINLTCLVLFKWSLDMTFTLHGIVYHHRIPQSGTVDIVGDNAWTPTWGGLLAGGTMVVHVTVLVGNSACDADLTDYKIQGHNPDRSILHNAVLAKNLPFLDNLICAESSYRQFATSGADEDWPLWGTPDGWGLCQLEKNVGTNFARSESDFWDWRHNLATGVDLYHGKEKIVAQHIKNVFQKYPNAKPFPDTFDVDIDGNGMEVPINAFDLDVIQGYNGYAAGYYVDYDPAINDWVNVNTSGYVEQVLRASCF